MKYNYFVSASIVRTISNSVAVTETTMRSVEAVTEPTRESIEGN